MKKVSDGVIDYLATNFKRTADELCYVDYEMEDWLISGRPPDGRVRLCRREGNYMPILMEFTPGKLAIFLHTMLLDAISNVTALAQEVLRKFRPELLLMKDSDGFVLLENMTGSLMGTFKYIPAGMPGCRWQVEVPLTVRDKGIVLPMQLLTFNDMRGCL